MRQTRRAGAHAAAFMSRRGVIAIVLAVAVILVFGSVALVSTGGGHSAPAGAGAGEGPQIYVAQTGAGSQSGAGGCANAHPLWWLKVAGNWGRGSGRVAPGTTVDLCGTLAEPVEVMGSGSPGKPVTILFTRGARIAMGGYGCPPTGCIDLGAGREYITIDGGVDGVVENTDRGTSKERDGQPTKGILGTASRHITIENLEIANMYVATGEDDIPNTEIQGISFTGGEPSYIAIDHDVLHDIGWAINVELNGKSSHVNIDYDTLYHDSHGISPTGGTAGGEVGPVAIAHDHYYANGNWSAKADVNHIDGLHCYTGNGQTAGLHWGPSPKGLFIYDNTFTVEGEAVTAPFYLEGSTGPQCGDRTSNFWIFNNVLTARGSVLTLNNGLLAPYSGEEHIFNNTLIGNSADQGVCIPLHGESDTSAAVQFTNNIATTCRTLVDAEASHLRRGAMNHNLYANAGATNEALVCRDPDRHEFFLSQSAAYRRCIGGEQGSIFATSAQLNLKETVGVLGRPRPGSPALRRGANLGRLCPMTPERALCRNIRGEPRSTTGAWNIGAY